MWFRKSHKTDLKRMAHEADERLAQSHDIASETAEQMAATQKVIDRTATLAGQNSLASIIRDSLLIPRGKQ